MSAAARAQTRTLVLTGAESSGKTTLALDLAAHFEAPLVGEYARQYLEQQQAVHGSDFAYTEADVQAIAIGQYEAERQASAAQPQMLVLDTDLLVIRIWLQVRYGRVPGWIDSALQAHAGRLYLLTSPDMPWAPDPLREHPAARSALHELYRAALVERGLAFIELTGSPRARVQQVLAHLQLQVKG